VTSPSDSAQKTAAGDQLAAVLPDLPIAPGGDWECPCGWDHPDQPKRTIVSLAQSACPFCGDKFRDEYRRQP
jgi:hypothetical protein